MFDNDFSAQMKTLKDSFRKGERFVLFVGAGQNGGVNVNLLWNQLIKEISGSSFRILLKEMGTSSSDLHDVMTAFGLEENPNKKVSKELIDYISNHFPIEIQVSMIKGLMKDHYIYSLQNQLYRECNYNIIKKSFIDIYSNKSNPPADFVHLKENAEKNKKELYTLFIIARMILLNPQIESVITYNFDNFIRKAVKVLLKYPDKFFNKNEIEFLKKRFRLKTCCDEELALADSVKIVDFHDNNIDRPKTLSLNSVPVYHVHGYIPDPSEEEITKSPNIVMALEDFIEQQTNGLSWQDAVQVEAFRNSNVIFIGCSMTDLTMKRMINFAHARGYSNKVFVLDAINPLSTKDENGEDKSEEQKNNDKNLFKQKRILSNLRKKYFETLGVKYIVCEEGFEKLCDTLYDISFLKLQN